MRKSTLYKLSLVAFFCVSILIQAQSTPSGIFFLRKSVDNCNCSIKDTYQKKFYPLSVNPIVEISKNEAAVTNKFRVFSSAQKNLKNTRNSLLSTLDNMKLAERKKQ